MSLLHKVNAYIRGRVRLRNQWIYFIASCFWEVWIKRFRTNF